MLVMFYCIVRNHEGMVFKPMPVTMVELRLHISETSHDISEELGLVSYAGGAMLQVVSECPPASLGWYSKCNLQNLSLCQIMQI